MAPMNSNSSLSRKLVLYEPCNYIVSHECVEESWGYWFEMDEYYLWKIPGRRGARERKEFHFFQLLWAISRAWHALQSLQNMVKHTRQRYQSYASCTTSWASHLLAMACIHTCMGYNSLTAQAHYYFLLGIKLRNCLARGAAPCKRKNK